MAKTTKKITAKQLRAIEERKRKMELKEAVSSFALMLDLFKKKAKGAKTMDGLLRVASNFEVELKYFKKNWK